MSTDAAAESSTPLAHAMKQARRMWPDGMYWQAGQRREVDCRLSFRENERLQRC